MERTVTIILLIAVIILGIFSLKEKSEIENLEIRHLEDSILIDKIRAEHIQARIDTIIVPKIIYLTKKLEHKKQNLVTIETNTYGKTIKIDSMSSNDIFTFFTKFDSDSIHLVK